METLRKRLTKLLDGLVTPADVEIVLDGLDDMADDGQVEIIDKRMRAPVRKVVAATVVKAEEPMDISAEAVFATVNKMAMDAASKSGRTREQEFAKLYESNAGIREMCKAADASRLAAVDRVTSSVKKMRAADQELDRLTKSEMARNGGNYLTAFTKVAATPEGQRLRGIPDNRIRDAA